MIEFNKNYDLIILNLMLPEIDGFDIGTDDYLSKPYELRELILRIESVLKRYSKIINNKLNYIIC